MNIFYKITLIILSVVATICLINPYPLFRLLGIILGFYIIPVLLIISLKLLPNKNIAINMLATLVLAFMLVRILFKTLHFPGAFLMEIGAFSLTVGLALTIIISFIRKSEHAQSGLKVLFIIALPLMLQYWPQKVEQNEQDYASLDTLYTQMESVIKSNDGEGCVHQSELKDLENLKHKMIANTGGFTEEGKPIGILSRDIVALTFQGHAGRNVLEANTTLTLDMFEGLNLGEALLLISTIEAKLLLDCK